MTTTTYEQLGHRVQRAVNSYPAQSNRHLVIERQPEESLEDWEQLLAEIDTNEHVTITRLDDGAVRLRWNLAEIGA